MSLCDKSNADVSLAMSSVVLARQLEIQPGFKHGDVLEEPPVAKKDQHTIEPLLPEHFRPAQPVLKRGARVLVRFRILDM